MRIRKSMAVLLIMVMLTSFSQAEALSYSDTWSVSYANVPGGQSVPDQVEVYYSTYGERANLLAHSCTVGNADYTARFTAVIGSMSAKTLGYNGSTYTQTVVLNLVITGPIVSAKFYVTGHTSTSYNVATLSGNVNTIQ